MKKNEESAVDKAASKRAKELRPAGKTKPTGNLYAAQTLPLLGLAFGKQWKGEESLSDDERDKLVEYLAKKSAKAKSIRGQDAPPFTLADHVADEIRRCRLVGKAEIDRIVKLRKDIAEATAKAK